MRPDLAVHTPVRARGAVSTRQGSRPVFLSRRPERCGRTSRKAGRLGPPRAAVREGPRISIGRDRTPQPIGGDVACRLGPARSGETSPERSFECTCSDRSHVSRCRMRAPRTNQTKVCPCWCADSGARCRPAHNLTWTTAPHGVKRCSPIVQRAQPPHWSARSVHAHGWRTSCSCFPSSRARTRSRRRRLERRDPMTGSRRAQMSRRRPHQPTRSMARTVRPPSTTAIPEPEVHPSCRPPAQTFPPTGRSFSRSPSWPRSRCLPRWRGPSCWTSRRTS